MEEKELVVLGPSALISQALLGSADLEKVEKLLTIQERWEANEAKKAFVVAMAAFKADPPKIEKTKQVSFGSGSGATSYKHALLADAAEKINRALSQHGLSAAWSTKQDGEAITVTCSITHSMGHSESTSLSAAPDKSGAKNAIQAIGSTVSYLERYTLFALTGLASHDMDDDGDKGATQFITDEQSMQIHALINDNGLDDPEHKWLCSLLRKVAKAESLETIPAKNHKEVMNAINYAIKVKTGGKK